MEGQTPTLFMFKCALLHVSLWACSPWPCPSPPCISAELPGTLNMVSSTCSDHSSSLSHPAFGLPLVSCEGRQALASSSYHIQPPHTLFPHQEVLCLLAKITTWVLQATQHLQFVKWEGSLPKTSADRPVLERVSAFQVVCYSWPPPQWSASRLVSSVDHTKTSKQRDIKCSKRWQNQDGAQRNVSFILTHNQWNNDLLPPHFMGTFETKEN